MANWEKQLLLNKWEVCFLFRLLELRKIHGKIRETNWWNYLMNSLQEWRNLSTNATAIFTENRPYEAVHYYLLIVSNGRVSFDVKVNFSKKYLWPEHVISTNNEFLVEFWIFVIFMFFKCCGGLLSDVILMLDEKKT